MINKIINLYKKYEQIISYLIFGILTTLVSIGTYILFRQVFHIEYLISNLFSWILSVLFAYLTNKKYVFKSTKSGKKEIGREIFQFYFYRIVSLLVEMLGLYILVSVMKINDTFSKILMQFIVIILNYVFSKVFVFIEQK